MVSILESLIRIPSPSYQEEQIGRFLVEVLTKRGYIVTTQSVSPNRFNVLAMTTEDPIVLLNSHMDTVSPYCEYRKREDTIWGRGACDAKGQIAAMISAGDRLREQGILNFALLFVVGEEVESDGAKLAANMNLPSKYVVIGEPTDNKLARAQKGTLVFRVRAHGIEGHSCFPSHGDSAIHRLVSYLDSWLKINWGSDPVFGETTVNFGKISGGSAMNVIAGGATAEGIFRVATSLAQIKKVLREFPSENIDLEFTSESEPLALKTLKGFETQVVSFGSDASYLRPLGDVLIFGPGSIGVAHSEHEHIKIADLEQGTHLLENIVKQLLKESLT